MALRLDRYVDQARSWPSFGEAILAQWDPRSVVVYQAYRPETAEFARANGTLGGPFFSLDRMTWVKPGFLWMMFRSGWGTKPGQERVLAISLDRAFFDGLLRDAVRTSAVPPHGPKARGDVLVQWDPDHDPRGAACARRAIQLGIRGARLSEYVSGAIRGIEDITPFVHEQHAQVTAGALDRLMTPTETPYPPPPR